MKIKLMISLLTLGLFVSCTNSDKIEEGFLDINGTSLFYKTKGSGEPIVVLHGGPGFDHRQFLPFIWELSSKYKVILYDQRGTGLSSGPVDSTSINIAQFVDDIEGIRKAFNIDKINLLGHSWGGILAQYYSIKHPDKLKSLILASTTASFKAFGEMRSNYDAARLPEDAKLLQEIGSSKEFQDGDPDVYSKFWRVYFKPYFPDQSQVSKMDLIFTENTITNVNAVGGYLFNEIGAFELHEEIKIIDCPTLIIHGDSDPMPMEYAEKIHRSIDTSKLVIVEDTGHWLFIDGTEEFKESIFKFMSGIDK